MAGYPQLSSVMTSHPELAISRTFMALNLRNLLYMQAELMHLERELQMIVQEDTQSPEPKRQALQTDWLSLEKSLGEGGEPDQWAKVLEIRRKLEHYSKILTGPRTNIVANAYRRRLYAVASSTATCTIASNSK